MSPFNLTQAPSWDPTAFQAISNITAVVDITPSTNNNITTIIGITPTFVIIAPTTMASNTPSAVPTNTTFTGALQAHSGAIVTVGVALAGLAVAILKRRYLLQYLPYKTPAYHGARARPAQSVGTHDNYFDDVELGDYSLNRLDI